MTARSFARTTCLAATTAAIATASTLAFAQAESPLHFEIGARVGYAVPLGDIYGNGGQTAVKTGMSDYIDGMIPFVGELGVRIARSVFVGAYLHYGIVSIASSGPSCQGLDTCDGHDVRLGGELLYHLNPEGPPDPWLGIGFGYEWMTVHSEGSKSVPGFGTVSASLDSTLSGFEYVNLQLGVDYVAGHGIGLGPFVMLTVAQFGSYDKTTTQTFAGRTGTKSDSGDIQDTAVHEWWIFGLRGTFVAL